MLKQAAYGIGGLVLAGAAYQLLGSYCDRRRFPPPGKLIAAGGRSLHLHAQGKGEPVVVLEAGIAATSLGWSLVQPEIAKFTTVCSYDRAGLGWSGTHARQLTAEQMSRDLEHLLSASGHPPPFILVGHSFGGLLIRAFAHRYPALVAGLLFLDPVSLNAWCDCSESQRRRLTLGAKLSRRGALLARLGIVRAALALLTTRGGKGISKRIGRAAAGKGAGALERLVGEVQKLPREVWPAIRSHWSEPKSFLAMAAYLESLPGCASEVLGMTLPRGVPVVILSAGNATPEEIKEREQMIEGHPNARHVVLQGAGHWLQLERPEEIVSTVRGLARSIRPPFSRRA